MARKKTTAQTDGALFEQSESRLLAAIKIKDVGHSQRYFPISPELYPNIAWTKLVGYAPDELPPYDEFENWLEEIVHPDDLAVMEKDYRDFIEGLNEDFHVEIRMRHKSGDRVHVEAFCQAISRDEQGRVTELIGMMLDITEKKKMQQELQLLYNAVEKSPSGFDIVNEDGIFTYVNKAYLDLWGYQNRDEVLGTSPVSHCADPKMPEKIVKTVNENGVGVFEFLAKRKDGSVFDVRMLVASHIGLDGKRIYHGFSEDITAMKKAQQDAKQRSESLLIMVDAMAGREIRMAELKEVIQKLRTQLKDAGMKPVANDPLYGENS